MHVLSCVQTGGHAAARCRLLGGYTPDLADVICIRTSLLQSVNCRCWAALPAACTHATCGDACTPAVYAPVNLEQQLAELDTDDEVVRALQR
jgi:hypothetical protein